MKKKRLNIVIGLDVLYRKEMSRHSNRLAGTVTLPDPEFFFQPAFGSESFLSSLRRLANSPKMDIIFYSPFAPSETQALENALASKLSPVAPKVLVPLVSATEKDLALVSERELSQEDEFEIRMKNHQENEKALDLALRAALESADLDLSRTVVIDSRYSFDGMSLHKNRIGGRSFTSHSMQDGLRRHLYRLCRLSGDLREKDLTFYFEDYQDEGRESLLAWATSIDYPEADVRGSAFASGGLSAVRQRQRVLSLDLDGTLIYTDETPISKEGKRRYEEALSLLLGLGSPSVERDEAGGDEGERASTDAAPPRCDYLLAGGEYGGFVRPGLLELLAVAREVFDQVCIYTAAREDYARAVIEQVIPEALRPNFVLHRAHTFRQGMSSPPSKTLLVFKAMGFDPSRVLMVDDHPEFYSYSRKNLVAVPGFYGSKDDGVLFELASLILSLKGVRSFSRASFPKSLQSKRK